MDKPKKLIKNGHIIRVYGDTQAAAFIKSGWLELQEDGPAPAMPTETPAGDEVGEPDNAAPQELQEEKKASARKSRQPKTGAKK